MHICIDDINFQSAFISTGNDSYCKHQLVEQPANLIACNPYPNGRIIVRCKVETDMVEASPLNLAWYKRDVQQENTIQRIYTGVTSRNSEFSFESELTILLQNVTHDATDPISEEPTKYFCRVTNSNGRILSDSQDIYLFPQPAADSLSICDKGVVHSTRTQKCIDPDYNTEREGMSSSSTTPLAAAEAGSVTTMSPRHGGGESPDDLGLLLDTDLLLYAAVGAAVLLMIIVFVLVLCLCLCNKLCKKSGYCTCCV